MSQLYLIKWIRIRRDKVSGLGVQLDSQTAKQWDNYESGAGWRISRIGGVINQFAGLTEDPNDCTTIIVPFLQVNSGNIYCHVVWK
jgi:hypothetical protein